MDVEPPEIIAPHPELLHSHPERNLGIPIVERALGGGQRDPELGVPKTPWKHGILNNASDDARQKISDKLAEWKHALDCRRKDDNRSRAQKWFTGEA